MEGYDIPAGAQVRVLEGHKRKYAYVGYGRGLVPGRVYTVTDQREWAHDNEVAVINPDDAPDNPWFVDVEHVELVEG